MAWHLISYREGKKVEFSRYRPGVAQRVGRGIALLFHDRGTRRGWVVSSTPRPHFTPGKDPVPILQEAGWAAGPVWTGGKSRSHRDSIPDRPAPSQSLFRLSYRAHNYREYPIINASWLDITHDVHLHSTPDIIRAIKSRRDVWRIWHVWETWEAHT